MLWPFPLCPTNWPQQDQSGFLAIDWSNPITLGLSYFRLLNDLNTPVYYASRGKSDAPTLDGTPKVGVNAGGLGITGGGGKVYANHTYTVNQSVGSMFAYVSASFSPTDSVAHYIVSDLNNKFSSPIKYADNKWYFGWNVPDTRATGAASGTFNAGDTFVVGGTWTSGGTKLYIKDKLQFTNVTTPTTGSTSGGNFIIGEASAGTAAWIATSGKDSIYWIAFWDRDLSRSEISALTLNPYGFLIDVDTPEYLLNSIAAATAKLRFYSDLNGLGGSGPFFHDRLAA